MVEEPDDVREVDPAVAVVVERRRPVRSQRSSVIWLKYRTTSAKSLRLLPFTSSYIPSTFVSPGAPAAGDQGHAGHLGVQFNDPEIVAAVVVPVTSPLRLDLE